MKKCIFCDLLKDKEIVESNDYAVVFYDGFSVTKYHTFIIPKRHVADYFEIEKVELDSINELLYAQKMRLESLDATITDFNIEVNVGKDAEQSIFHVHVHLKPKRQ